jgi:hypothetical protein
MEFSSIYSQLPLVTQKCFISPSWASAQIESHLRILLAASGHRGPASSPPYSCGPPRTGMPPGSQSCSCGPLSILQSPSSDDLRSRSTIPRVSLLWSRSVCTEDSSPRWFLSHGDFSPRWFLVPPLVTVHFPLLAAIPHLGDSWRLPGCGLGTNQERWGQGTWWFFYYDPFMNQLVHDWIRARWVCSTYESSSSWLNSC